MPTPDPSAVHTLFRLYRLPTGRRMYAMREVERRAAALELTAVVEHATRSLAHDRALLRLEGRYSPTRVPQYGPDAREHDRIVDRALSALGVYLDSQGRLFGDAHERGRAARRLKERFFPRGVAAVTTLSFAEEHVYVSEMIAAADEPEVAEAMGVLDELGVMFDELEAVNVAYGAALGADDARPSAAEVRAARTRGHQLMLEVLSLAIGHAGVHAPDEPEVLAHLIEPVTDQHLALAQVYRRRSRVSDVDPDTGEEQPQDPPEPSDPAAEPAPGQPPAEPGDPAAEPAPGQLSGEPGESAAEPAFGQLSGEPGESAAESAFGQPPAEPGESAA